MNEALLSACRRVLANESDNDAWFALWQQSQYHVTYRDEPLFQPVVRLCSAAGRLQNARHFVAAGAKVDPDLFGESTLEKLEQNYSEALLAVKNHWRLVTEAPCSST